MWAPKEAIAGGGDSVAAAVSALSGAKCHNLSSTAGGSWLMAR